MCESFSVGGKTPRLRLLACAAALVGLPSISHAQLFSDNFNTAASSANYVPVSTDTRNGLNGYYDSFAPPVNVSNLPVQGANNGGPAQQNGSSFAGAFGMAWHQVQLLVDVDGGTAGAPAMKWFIDGKIIGTMDAGANGAFVTDGRVTLGYSDPTSNQSDNPPLSFALVDNLVVDVVPEPTGLVCAAMALVLGSMRRRKTRG